jgi:hypothetical protein
MCMPFVQLNGNAFPNLYYDNSKIEWNSGAMYAVQFSAPVVKINRDRVQWYGYGTFHPSRLWRHMPCEPVRGALCSIVQESPPASVLVFPSGAVDVPLNVDQLVLPRDFLGFMQNTGRLICSQSTSNRMLSFSDNRYEISMCDLVDENFEFVLTPDTNLLYVRRRVVHLWVVLVLSALSLYLFIKTCEHFVELVHGRRPCFAHGSITLPFAVALFSLGKLALTDSTLILQEEITLQVVCGVYTLAHTGLHLWRHLRHAQEAGATDESFFSSRGAAAVGPLIAAQVLLSLELNQSIDTPFLSIYVCLFGLRNFLKFLNLLNLHFQQASDLQNKLFKTLEVFADTFVFACLIGIGVQIAVESREQYAADVVGLCVVSILAGTLLHQITLMHLAEPDTPRKTDA